ncbi:SPRY-domain-containing protein [Lepidopterella palustris CBS 459.81]|uniref:SPRY-domain-containing protein n=1 Tax=Lepidopterella palustris CBS 459.81 TaxID=1314670 RepID=A0A8E2J9R2_9PEZI|nr:SPRY-domain-containing protein [Lepidopterella palustris CBS 459.81]
MLILIIDQVDSTELKSRLQVRANHPVPVDQRVAYFEISIHSTGANSLIGIGFCNEDSPCIGMPGWGKGSWAYHGDDGKLFLEKGQGVQYGPTYGAGDVIGCGVDNENNEMFFTKNGVSLGKWLASNAPKGRLFAVAGIGDEGVHISVNFGPSGFLYNRKR